MGINHRLIDDRIENSVNRRRIGRAGNLLIAHSLIALKSNEWLWAICSDCSGQMSDCEQIAQVAHDKWANLSFAHKKQAIYWKKFD